MTTIPPVAGAMQSGLTTRQTGAARRQGKCRGATPAQTVVLGRLAAPRCQFGAGVSDGRPPG